MNRKGLTLVECIAVILSCVLILFFLLGYHLGKKDALKSQADLKPAVQEHSGGYFRQPLR